MQTLTVYDPPMCCSTGVCGPEVDPKLARFAGDLKWLEEQGINVERLNLAQEPERFVENAAVKAILERSGNDELPVIVVNDAVFVSGRYPDRDELAACVGLASEAAGSAFDEQVADRLTGDAEKAPDAKACCDGSKPPEQKTSGCC